MALPTLRRPKIWNESSGSVPCGSRHWRLQLTSRKSEDSLRSSGSSDRYSSCNQDFYCRQGFRRVLRIADVHFTMDLDDVNIITDFLTKNKYPRNFSNNDKRSLRQKAKSFVCCADSEGTTRLFHRGKNNRNQLVVCDPELKRAILLAAHIDVTGPGSGRPSTTAGGIPHNGINTTRRKISDQYWWRRLVEDVRSYCKECTGCCHVPATITPAYDQSSLDDVNDSEDAGIIDELSESLPSTLPHPPAMKVTRCDPSYCGRMLESLRLMKEQQIYTDAVVVSEDSTFQQPVHRVVMASASAYFKSLFDNSVQSVYYVVVPCVSGLCLEELISYVYTGELPLAMSSVHELCSAAEQLGMTAAAELCQNYLAEATERLVESDTSENNDQAERILAPIVDYISEDMSGTLKTKSSRQHAITNATLNSPSCSEIDTPKQKHCKGAKYIQDVVLHRSKQRQIDIKTLSPAVACGDDDEVTEDENAVSYDLPVNSVPRKRNATKRKKASRYVEPTIQLEKSTRATIEVRKKTYSTDGEKTRMCSLQRKHADKVRHYNKSSQHGANTRVIIQSYRWTFARQSIHKAIGRLSQSKARRTSAGRYACYLCISTRPTFPNTSSLAAHCIHWHRQWKCLLCAQRFTSWYARSRHNNIVHSYSGLNKLEVQRRRLHNSAANIPIHDEHQVELNSTIEHLTAHNKCGWCGKKFTHRSELLVHRDSVHRRPKTPVSKVRRRVIREWSCSEKGCGERFKVKEKLRDHMALSHPSVIFSCPECRFKTQVEIFLKRHLLRRHRIQHSCHLCGKSYHKPFLLRVHLYYRHKITDPSLRIYTCSHEDCLFACPSKNGLDQHLLKHSLSKSYVCVSCGKTFKREAGLNKHTRKVHLGIRPYMCDKCGVSCGDETELKLHLTRHIESKRFTCDHCPYSTFQRSSLKSHMFTRHNVRIDKEMAVLQCTTCGFATDKRCRYNDHMKMHQNIRDIPCSLCGKLFVTKKTLRQHVNKVHGRIVTNSALLDNVPRALMCSLCLFQTANPVEMNEHVQTIHVEDIVTRLSNVSDYVYDVTSVGGHSATSVLPSGIMTSVVSQQNTIGSLQSSTLMPNIDDVLIAGHGTVKCQMIMPLATSAGCLTKLQNQNPLDTLSMATVNSIIVDIPLPIENTAVSYANFQPFDVSNRLVGL